MVRLWGIMIIGLQFGKETEKFKDKEAFAKLTDVEIIQELKKRGLATNGVRTERIDR